jgi:hypothetical protein
MGTLAETANVDYGLTFANQGKKNFCFPFPFSVYILKWQKYIYSIYIYILPAQAIFLYLLLFAHLANGSLLFVCLFTKKQMEVIRLQTD